MQNPKITRLTEEGLDAFRRGNAQAAFDRLKAAADAGAQDRDVHMGLAIVARLLKRFDIASEAATRVLAQEPRNCEAMILKADALAGLGQTKDANAAYMQALRIAPPAHQLEPHLKQDLARAQSQAAKAAQAYEDHLRQRVIEAGLNESGGQSRIGQSLDIMFGRKQVYQQQPLRFYLPELPQIQFYDAHSFPWVKDLEAAAPEIIREAAAIYEQGAGLEPYVPQTDRPGGPRDHAAMAGNQNWSAFHFYRQGEAYQDHLARCPATAAALSRIPQPAIPGNSPTALFSVLKPGAVIPPHHGMMNVRLIGHLGLKIPGDCSLRVGNQTRAWREGEVLIFDDSIEHEAWNKSAEVRIVLLFDLWRPELTEDERRFAQAIYEGITSFEA